MNRASPQMRIIAEQLVAAEAQGNASAAADLTLCRPLGRLRSHLSMLMGRGGFQALLARALVLATAEVPWLKAVQVVADGELQGMTSAQGVPGGGDVSEGEVVLLAQLLGLLVAFVGPTLTLRLIIQLWPQLSFDDADFSTTATQGKAQ